MRTDTHLIFEVRSRPQRAMQNACGAQGLTNRQSLGSVSAATRPRKPLGWLSKGLLRLKKRRIAQLMVSRHEKSVFPLASAAACR
ncbi:hypothetical protein BBB56_15220 [Candidatus Pantoea deserta]|uniref:Uncharacterized protein n=1 Tax=Candidatus Pantoea deserta TaxID=1869313 RepID=A0A3N4NRR1_9GAMM|nr:hypothetical protein BBB56_15220 [Pantoea deserta]